MTDNFDSDLAAAAIASLADGGKGKNSLMTMLGGADIQPGDDPSYQLCKIIYLYHPLGQKMAESPVTYAMSQRRECAVQDTPKEVVEAFEKQWEETKADEHIKAAKVLSRAYGASVMVIDTVESYEKDATAEPLDMENIWDKRMFISEFDPLNTAGSLVLDQIPTAPDFQKPVRVVTNGRLYHKSRCVISFNEMPIYLAFTSSAFGYSGRSVYQRALFPLKSFIRSMVADDMIETKLGLLVAKMKSPGSIVNGIMQRIAGAKRRLLKTAQTGHVLEIDVDEAIETLDMNNTEAAGNFARGNILKNAATAADMPAWFLENEALRDGLSEGSEDAKNIARYIERLRDEMLPLYQHMDMVCMYRAWNPEFTAFITEQYPDQYQGKTHEEIFSLWREAFTAVWPSFIIEPESEKAELEGKKIAGLIDVVTLLIAQLDPDNQATVLQWAVDNINDNKLLFTRELILDFEGLADFRAEQQKRMEENEAKQIEAMAQGAKAMGGAKGPGAPNGGKAAGNVGGKPGGSSGGNAAGNLGKLGGK